MEKGSKQQVANLVNSFKMIKTSKGDQVKQDIQALQGFKLTLEEKIYNAFIDEMRSQNLIKGSRGGTSDSKACKEIRNLYEMFLKECKSKGLIVRDEAHYTLTNKVRLVVLDANEDRIQPSLNMSNVDSKIRKAKDKEAHEIAKG